jgi:hypothetical protein
MPRYAAGWNQPGYLPDDPGSVGEFDSLADAQAYLVGELDRADDIADGERAAAASGLNSLTGPGTAYAGGWAWWIQNAEGDGR